MTEHLIPRSASGDDVIVPIRMRRSSFEKLTAELDGRAVPIGGGTIGLVRDGEDVNGDPVWTLVVWSPEPVWRGVLEQIPANEQAVKVLLEFHNDDEHGDWG